MRFWEPRLGSNQRGRRLRAPKGETGILPVVADHTGWKPVPPCKKTSVGALRPLPHPSRQKGCSNRSRRLLSAPGMKPGHRISHPGNCGIEAVREFARLDLHRHDRTGIPEVVFAEGKSTEQVISILASLAEKSGQALATRVSAEGGLSIKRKLGRRFIVVHNPAGRLVEVQRRGFRARRKVGCIAVLAAGTADVRVAEEARVTAELMGCEVLKFYDVGIAGIHRLAEPLRQMRESDVSCLVVAAGMEGALPSVVRGLVDVPVIGVPVSTGYGYGGRGEGALMTMLQSCSPGLTVVNIDIGFGAGATAALIARRAAHRGLSRD